MEQHRGRKIAVPHGKKGVMMAKSKEIHAGAKGKEPQPDVRDVGSSHKKTEITTKKGDYKMEMKTGFPGFDMKAVSGDVLKFMKFSLDTTFGSVAKVQEFNEKLVKDMIEINRKANADAEKMVNEFIENGKKGVDEYKKVVEEGFKKVEELMQPQQ
jgi:hypothetical protein